MSKKVKQYIIRHPWGSMILFFIFVIIFAFIISKLSENVVEIMVACVLLLMIVILYTMSCKEKKEKQKFQNASEDDYKRKWMQYVDLVNETINEENYERNKLNTNWIQIFNQVMYEVSTNMYLLRRMFYDFDFAACLVYSLTWDNTTDENILFAFDCAKKIIGKPKEYTRDIGYGYKLELKTENIFQEVSINIPDGTITAEALVSIIRAYLMQKTENRITQLSDFLHILYLHTYLKCE